MCDALYELFADQLVQNRNDGLKEGLDQGMKLALKLIADNRNSEIDRALSDPVYRKILINEYHL